MTPQPNNETMTAMTPCPPPTPLNAPERGPRPCFPSGTPIPAPEFWPLDDTTTRMSMFLPVKGEGYVAARFSRLMRTDAVSDFLQSFRLDPEGTIMCIWGDGCGAAGLVPELISISTGTHPRATNTLAEAAVLVAADDLDI